MRISQRVFSRLPLGTDADDGVNRFLGALSGHGRLAIRLTVLDLLSRRHNLRTELTLLINNLLTGFEGVVEDDFGLERNRLLHLRHHSGVLSRRAVLDDLVDRVLRLLLLRGHRRLVTRGGEVSGEGLLARHALLDDLDLTRLEFRVRAGLNLERNLRSPGYLRRSLRRFRADLDDLINRLLSDLLFDGGLTIRLGVGHFLSHRGGLLARLTLGYDLEGASRQVRIKLDLHTKRNLRLNRLLDLTGGLSANADDLLDRLLGALSRHGRIAIRLAALDLLRRGHNLGTSLTLLINLLFAFLEGVVEDDLGLERNRLLHLGHHSGVLSSRAVLDDLLDRILRLLLLRGHRRLVTRGGEVSGEGLLARHALLDDLDLTRLEFRVRAGLNLERNLRSPGHLLGRLRRFRANLDHLINRLLSDLLLDGSFTVRLGVGDLLGHGNRLLTRLTLGYDLGGASRQVRVEFDLHTKRNLRLNSLRDLFNSVHNLDPAFI